MPANPTSESSTRWWLRDEAQVVTAPQRDEQPPEARAKRVAFGFTNFENFRIRALLMPAKPNFRVLDSMVVA